MSDSKRVGVIFPDARTLGYVLSALRVYEQMVTNEVGMKIDPRMAQALRALHRGLENHRSRSKPKRRDAPRVVEGVPLDLHALGLGELLRMVQERHGGSKVIRAFLTGLLDEALDAVPPPE